jgi:4-amino-4-deoxy-L-arabinose transferase-like glycosyltransferase
MWGLWLVLHAAVFSLMSGIIHSYYVVAMAPAIGALVGGGLTELWSARAAAPRRPWAGIVLAAGVVGSAAVAWVLLARTPEFAPGLAIGIAAVAVGTAVVLALPAIASSRALQVAALGLAIATLLAGPAAYALDTMQTGDGGGDPAAGPHVASAGGPGGFGRAGGFGGSDGSGPFAGGPDGGAPAGAGTTDSSLTTYLSANRGSARWIVAARSAMQAGSIELATGQPVMAMGGFSGSDPAPTLDQLRAYVASGELRFVLVGGGGPAGGFAGPGGASTDIESWVTSTCSPVSSVSTMLYDCAGSA